MQTVISFNDLLLFRCRYFYYHLFQKDTDTSTDGSVLPNCVTCRETCIVRITRFNSSISIWWKHISNSERSGADYDNDSDDEVNYFCGTTEEIEIENFYFGHRSWLVAC